MTRRFGTYPWRRRSPQEGDGSRRLRRVALHTRHSARAVLRIISARLSRPSPPNARSDALVRAASAHHPSSVRTKMAALATTFVSLKAAAAAPTRRTAARRNVTVRASGFEMPSQYKKVRSLVRGSIIRASAPPASSVPSRCDARSAAPADNVRAFSSTRTAMTHLPLPTSPCRSLPSVTASSSRSPRPKRPPPVASSSPSPPRSSPPPVRPSSPPRDPSSLT